MRLLLAALAFVLAGSAAHAQEAATGPCATPDSVAFRLERVPGGNQQLTDDQLRDYAGITPKSRINARIVDRAVRDLYATNAFESDITAACEVTGGKAILVFNLRERRVLSDIKVTGPDKISTSSVRDRIDLLTGKPIDPAQVAKAVSRIDSLYQAQGYFLAKPEPIERLTL